MSDAVREGKVRHLGICEAGAATIGWAHAVHPLSAVQIAASSVRAGRGERAALPGEPPEAPWDLTHRLPPTSSGRVADSTRELQPYRCAIVPVPEGSAMIISKGRMVDDHVPRPG
jgi:hypothetical protein